MTQRKPSEVSWECWVDAQIRRARELGEFDVLEGRGKPLSGLGGRHDPNWWVNSWMQRERLTPMLPQTLKLKKDVEQFLARLPSISTAALVREGVAAMNSEIIRVNSRPSSGPPSTTPPLCADDIVARWRRERSAQDERRS